MATVPEASTSSILPTSNDSTSQSRPSILANAPISVGETNSKLRQLKDRMWVRETLEDLTAAEFACSLSVEDAEASSNGGENKAKRKRAVDFENILNKLDVRIEEMCVLTSEEISKQLNQTCHVLDRPVLVGDEEKTTIENSCYSLAENIGMGSVVYTTEQREALLKRLIATRGRLVNFIEGSESAESTGSIGEIDDIRSKLQPEDYAGPSKKEKAMNGTKGSAAFDPSLYVREDGTIDWDGALQDREALKKFGGAVWSRINGQDPERSENGEGHDLVSSHSQSKAVTAKIEETVAIREKRERLDVLVKELNEMEVEHTKLLNSGKINYFGIYHNLEAIFVSLIID